MNHERGARRPAPRNRSRRPLGEVFDISFREFVAVRCISVIYTFGLLATTIVGCPFLYRWTFSLLEFEGRMTIEEVVLMVGGLLAIFIGAVAAGFTLRVIGEMLVVLFRIAESVTAVDSAIRERSIASLPSLPSD